MTGTVLCSIPLNHVVEILRPLPIEPLPGAPAAVAGVAVVRGAPLPVLAVGQLLDSDARPGRLVIVRAGDRQVGLAVDGVLGIRMIPGELLSGLPPLLDRGVSAVADIATLDGALMLVLDSARVVPQEVLDALADQIAAS